MTAHGAEFTLARLALFAGLLGVPVGCGGVDQPLREDSSEVATEAEPLDEATQQLALNLELAKAQWANLGAANYTVKTRRACFCAPEPADHVAVTVRAGQAISAYGQDNNGDYTIPVSTPGMRDWYTVPGMFARIETNLGKADRVSVVFDPARGFPTELTFDYQVISADEGEYFEMWDLRLD